MAKMKLPDESDRIRANTNEEINRRIDRDIEDNIRYYATQNEKALTERIDSLEDEWDVDRLVQLCISGASISSILLGVFGSKKWWLIAAAGMGLLGNHAVNGWCPSAMVFRRMGFRTRQEIDREKYALKAIRGDFDELTQFDNTKLDEKVLAAIDAVKSL